MAVGLYEVNQYNAIVYESTRTTYLFDVPVVN